MPKFLKHEVVAKLLEVGVLPTFYEGDLETAKKILVACADGGAKVVEFTNRGALAYQVFSDLIKWRDKERPDLILGVGTVLDPATASLFINSGADFVVGPVFNPEIAKICNRRKVAYIPGCDSPSEISAAEESGADIIKVFPADVLGPRFIKDMMGPCPWSRLMPSGGVEPTRESIFEWIKAGAAALNMGSNLIVKDLVKAGDFDGIRKKVENAIAWVKEARGVPLFLGVEHIGLYPTANATAADIADWYSNVFGFAKKEGASSIFVSGLSFGRIEIVKSEEKGVHCHVAVLVSNFEAACEYLRNKGIELEEPSIKPGVKAVYLKKTDPAGNRVHLLYRA
jgi:2-dehydro-3-deoxyphosphogluconate aldolase/(4S)-4-hydroxy-2-oxoglutarate aldolase